MRRNPLSNTKVFTRRAVTGEEHESWMKAAESRPDSSIKSMEKILNDANSVRLWRMRRDYKWARKILAKNGINPERARELL